MKNHLLLKTVSGGIVILQLRERSLSMGGGGLVQIRGGGHKFQQNQIGLGKFQCAFAWGQVLSEHDFHFCTVPHP